VDFEAGGYSVFHKGTEELRDEAREIVSLCKQYDAVMETSHLSPQEVLAMMKECKNQGFSRIVITHANSFATPYPIELQKELVEMGADIMYCYVNYMPMLGTGAEPPSNLANLIRQIGIDHVVLGTDFGAEIWPSAIEGVRMMIANLLRNDFSEEEIARLVKSNPDRIYGN
jgi:microsomal dipeptidase-like Zn-dependent dipeptidase